MLEEPTEDGRERQQAGGTRALCRRLASPRERRDLRELGDRLVLENLLRRDPNAACLARKQSGC